MKKIRSYERQKGRVGYAFISLWLIGTFWFFILPLAKSLLYVFNEVTIGSGKIDYKFVGLKNLKEILFEDAETIRLMTESILSTAWETVLIVVFSLFLAIILNQKFKGQKMVKAIFVLPVIVASGVLMTVFKQDLFVQSNSISGDSIFQSAALEKALIDMNIPINIINFISNTVSQVLDIVWKSGVEILLFTTGLNSIPSSLYEVCDVEGATGWQTFWMLTFPMVTPFILLNTIYAIIDSFTYYSNPVMLKFSGYIQGLKYSYGTSLALIYFILVGIIASAVLLIMSRKTFYIEK